MDDQRGALDPAETADRVELGQRSHDPLLATDEIARADGGETEVDPAHRGAIAEEGRVDVAHPAVDGPGLALAEGRGCLDRDELGVVLVCASRAHRGAQLFSEVFHERRTDIDKDERADALRLA